MLSLDGLSYSLLQSQQAIGMSTVSVTSMFHTARKLEQWDLPVPVVPNDDVVTIYKTMQSVYNAVNLVSVRSAIETGLSLTISNLLRPGAGASSIHTSLQSLAIVTEIDEVLSGQGSEQFEEIIARFQNRSLWMKTGK
jgi:ataxia telangiectasia mutated family protein